MPSKKVPKIGPKSIFNNFNRFKTFITRINLIKKVMTGNWNNSPKMPTLSPTVPTTLAVVAMASEVCSRLFWVSGSTNISGSKRVETFLLRKMRLAFPVIRSTETTFFMTPTVKLRTVLAGKSWYVKRSMTKVLSLLP